MSRPIGPEEHAAMKRIAGVRKVSDLLVLSNDNDPFYSGTDRQHENAQWFAELWERMSMHRAHLRRIHYGAFSIGFPAAPSLAAKGQTQYLNTDADWTALGWASKHARYLGYVDPERLIDQRNKSLNRAVEEAWRDSEFRFEYSDWGLTSDWRVSTFGPHVPLEVYANLTVEAPLDVGSWSLYGCNYDIAAQPALVEVWAEKTTVDDVLQPLCSMKGANLLSGAGFQSITNIIGLIRRTERYPTQRSHILYVSDYDAAGRHMPKQLARQVEFWIHKLESSAVITVQPIVLTDEQIEHYDLPRDPKDGKRVELDALEALHPGELRRIVGDAIDRWRDTGLQARYGRARREAESILRARETELRAELEEDVEEIRAEMKAVVASKQERINAINDRLRELLEDLAEQADEIREEIETEIAPLEEALRARRELHVEDMRNLADGIELVAPESEIPEADSDEYLFDSRRDWLTQLAAYKSTN